MNDLRARNIAVLSIVVAKVHAHFVAPFPDDMRQIRHIVGEVKRCSSRAVKKALPGKVWSRGEDATPIDDKEHLKAAHHYDLYKQGPEAWSWWYGDGSDEGIIGRRRSGPRQER